MSLENSPAPEFPGDLRWINVDHPVRLHEDLRGHVVLVYCWTASSVHCQHVIQTLSFLEQRFAGWPFQVVGIHSGKFNAECGHEEVRAAVQRLGVRHLVTVDRDRRLWKEWSCRSWPTLALVDPMGRVRFHGAGEPDRDRFGQAIDALLRDAESEGELALTPFRGAVGVPTPTASGLRFPSALHVDTEKRLLWIADTGHDRIVAAELEGGGRVSHVVGEGRPGAADGDLVAATFSGPRGLATDGERVFVADTGNHLLRAIDLDSASVETLSGTGRRGADLVGGQFSTDQPLCSPWDLVVHHGAVWITMAGAHQVWSFDLETHGASALLGTGVEGLQDGGFDCGILGQPAGLSTDGTKLAMVDAATGAVRVIDPEAVAVDTLLGAGSFVFGDRDGELHQARLQQPLGVAFWRGHPIVADTLNHKVKLVDAERGEIRTLLGSEQGLRCPEGVAVDGDVLFVADTGNHRIVRVELDPAGGVVQSQEFSLSGLLPPASRGLRELRPVELRAYGGIELRVRLPIPSGEMLHPEVPVLLRVVDDSGDPITAQEFDETVEVIDGHGVVDYLPLAAPGEGKLRIDASYVTCTGTEAVGHRQLVERVVPVQLADDGDDQLIVS